MNDDRDTRGQELSESDGYTRPGQVGDQRFDPVPEDGVTAPASSAGGHQPGGSAGGTHLGGPAGDSPDGWGGTPGVAGMTSAADGPGVVAGEPPGGAPDGAAESGADGIGPVPGGGRRRRKRRKGMSWWVELPVLLVFALILALLIKSFVVQAFYIPSSSMENTLEIGDKVLVNKLVYDFRPIHRGDIVVFNGDGSWDPEPTQTASPLARMWDSVTGLFGTAPGVHDFIKRVIGIPGDHVACCNARGQITVNGVALYEKSYLYPGNAPSTQKFNIVVPPGRLWVMGDHRAVSWDSRGHMNDPGDGTIPENHVVGRAFVIVAPISRWRILPIPATFEQPKLNESGSAALAANPGEAGLNVLRLTSGPLLGALALPGAPAATGLIAAVPFTLLQRRVRRRLARKRSKPDGSGGAAPRGTPRGPTGGRREAG
jgi:signal peptidase I